MGLAAGTDALRTRFPPPCSDPPANPFNQSRIATVVVAVLTSNLALAEAPGNVRLGKSDSGLPKSSIVNVSQIVTLDRQFLTERVRALPGAVMRRIDEGLRLVLGL